MATFPPSSIAELNAPTHGTRWETAQGEWSIVMDAARFHTFLVVELPSLKRAVRIDWRQSSRLEVEPYVAAPGDERIKMGWREGFCHACLASMLRGALREYALFSFNCRTVAYLIATEVCGFDPPAVYAVFDARDMICGLGEPGICVSMEEIRHYVASKRLEREKGHRQ